MANIKEAKRSAVDHNTPTISVYSNQGLAVRVLGYYRRAADEEAAVRISLQRYNNAGQLLSSVDSRLSNSYLKKSTAVIPNQQQQTSLSGNVLQSKNVDAGIRVLFSDVRGQGLWSWDSRGTVNEFEYDGLRRIKAVYEKARGKEQFCSERLSYGIAGEAGNNGVGRLIEHYDTAGRRVIPKYSLLGLARSEVRFFIKAEEEAHWVEEAVENEKRLEPTGYTSSWNYTALGEVIGQRDAEGNERGTVYDIVGQVSETWLQLKEDEKKSLSDERVYNARGQLQKERLGNGIEMNYRYELKTQRLSEKEAKRLSDSVVLQFLHYTYDPVGNILTIEDKAKVKEIDYYKNAKAEAISRYTYDSFYQLIVADGIESEQASQQGKLANAIVFGNKDASRLISYQRTYDYDAGGNLLEIGQLDSSPAMQLVIDTQSNRGIEKRESGPSLQESFDANGNLLYINTGQPLSWDNRNQLKESVQVERAEQSDKETYRYDGQGSRIEKRRTYLTESQIHTERVRYLPGLELREHWQTDRQGENLQEKERLVLIQAQGGGAPVKALHWELGQPGGIENDGMYYTLTDQIGSSQIELDNVGELINYEAYYPYGGTAIWSTQNQVISDYKYRRYSGKERDHSGLYYYGYRYYLPWLGRWLNPDPSGISQGLNLFEMVNNNPITFYDTDGRMVSDDEDGPPPPLPSSAPPPLPTSPPPSASLLSFEIADIGPPPLPASAPPLPSSLPPSLPVIVPTALPEAHFPWPPELMSDAGYHIFYAKPGEATQQIEVVPENYADVIDLLSEDLALISSGKAPHEVSNLSPSYSDVLYKYTAGSGQFNNPRKATPESVRSLNTALPALPEQKTTVFRASPTPKGVYGTKIQIGDIVSSDRFLSTTLFAGITTSFIDATLRAYDDMENIFFIINSSRGRYVSEFSSYGASEQEILHTTGSNFKVDFIQGGSIKPLNILQSTYKKPIKIKYVFLSEQVAFRGRAKNIYSGD